MIRIVDKLDKLPATASRSPLVETAGSTEVRPTQCLALAEITASDAGFVDAGPRAGRQHQLLDEGLEELAAVIDGTAAVRSDRFRVVASLSSPVAWTTTPAPCSRSTWTGSSC